MIDRRAFLGALPVTALAARGLAVRGTPRPDISLGVQLYTFREQIAEDLDAVLATIAQIGYREVELFQLHGLTAPEMKRRLDAVGLRAVSSHYGLGALRDDLDGALAGAVELGQELMIVPSIDGADRTVDGLARVAADFDRIAETIAVEGIRFGYHNHDWEFRPLGAVDRPIDFLLDRTQPDLVDWQMDIFWVVNGGGDPLSLLHERQGRVTSVHVKDRGAAGDMVDVGDGVIDFAAIIAAAEGQGLRHAFVEHDWPDDPAEFARTAIHYLHSIGVAG